MPTPGLKLVVHQGTAIEEYPLVCTPFAIGSDANNQLVIPGLFPFHATITHTGEQYFLTAMAPTKVNGQKVPLTVAQAIDSSSSIEVGSVIMQLVAGTSPAGQQATPTATQSAAPPDRKTVPEVVSATEATTVTQERRERSRRRGATATAEAPGLPQPPELYLDAKNLHKVSRPAFGKVLLDGISLSFRPGEFGVIAGVSGGGKSTLLSVLSGQGKATGQVLINGVSIQRQFSKFKKLIGYVPQDDIVHPELSAWEALNYSAMLRLQMSKADRFQRVQQVLNDLELMEHCKTPIHRLSGGQRKRVSIGIELIGNPGLLFLDEATSGLDPKAELNIMTLLRKLADQGRTVLLVTHHTKNVAIADLVIFLAAGGRLAYFGPSSNVLRYFGVRDFDEIYQRVENQPPRQWKETYNASAICQQYVGNRQSAIADGQQPSSPVPIVPRPTKKYQRQVLFDRNLRILLRSKMGIGLMVLGAPLLGALNFILWNKDLFSAESGDAGKALMMLYTNIIIALMCGTLATMPEIAKETEVYRRERNAGLELMPYLLSKLQLCLYLAIWQAAVLVVCFAAAVTFPVPPEAIAGIYLAMFALSFASSVLGLLVSAIAPNQAVAPLLAILVIVPQIVFGGGLIAPGEFAGLAKTINGLTITKYPFEALVTLSEMGKDVAEDFCWSQPEDERQNLSYADQNSCGCYSQNITSQCQFPGIAPDNGFEYQQRKVLRAQNLVAQFHKRYGSTFKVSILSHVAKLGAIVAVMVLLLFVVQAMK